MSKNSRFRQDYSSGGAKKQLNRMWIKYNGICQIGMHKISRKEASREHVIPLWMGGEKWDHNCVLACKRCNQEAEYAAKEKWPVEYEQMRAKTCYPVFITNWISSCLWRQSKGLNVTTQSTRRAEFLWCYLDEKPKNTDEIFEPGV